MISFEIIATRLGKEVNRILALFGLRLEQLPSYGNRKYVPQDFVASYRSQLKKASADTSRGFEVLETLCYNVGAHPMDHRDHECMFAADCISRIKPDTILDIGSYREFVLGLLSGYRTITLDVRPRKRYCYNEELLTGDATSLKLPENAVDVVLSLCTIEHFGLGRYGDDFDLDGDVKAIGEMKRVVKSGGHLIFTTTLTNAQPRLCFNAHRVYTYAMIHELMEQMILIEEKFYSYKLNGFCSLAEITRESGDAFDLYLGCWQKK